MSDILFNYLNRRLQHSEGTDVVVPKEPGPVITISRQSGCSARRLSEKLVEELNKRTADQKKRKEWDYINKELLEKAARELDVKPSEIAYVFKYQERNALGDIFASYANKYYKSDRKIRKTIADVLRAVASEGNIIIVGRAGVVLTKEIMKSLHISLEAPLEWRSLMISERYDLSFAEARKSVIEMDKKRQRFRESFEGRNTDYTWFDVTFNRMSLTEKEIIEAIIKMMETKKLI
ncbi:MAG: cytidylate kinase-like family protein [Marinilabiliales bacterium]|nr:MAG: cytidylate kinase-like family protein [Marinilabiliales bacterium]